MAVRGVFILFLFFYTLSSIAQPALPDITGSAHNGIVTLSWQSRYDHIKAITVLRSPDSAGNYTQIGTIKNPEKGIQDFTDKRPLPGNNYYKLTIRFSSGLNWGSNHCSVYIPTAIPKEVLKPALPYPIPITESGSFKPVEKTLPPLQKTETLPPKPAKLILIDTSQPANKTTAGFGMSFAPDTTGPAIKAIAEKSSAAVQRRLVLNSPSSEPDENSATLIRSKFIFADPVTNHVNMTLPDDVHIHHYSVKFYDSKNHVIIDIPKISAPNIIIDRRNFQRKGMYKFVLRRDVVELESGYITVNPVTPNP